MEEALGGSLHELIRNSKKSESFFTNQLICEWLVSLY